MSTAPRQRKPKTAKATALPVLISALEQGARVEDACALAKCSPSAFYQWQAEDTEFMEAIAHAREAFARSVDMEIAAAASERLRDLLKHGHTVTKTTTETTFDDTGERRVVKETVEEVRYTTPQWVFEKLMPKSLEDALPGALHQHVHFHKSAEA